MLIRSSELKNARIKWQSPSQIWRVKQPNHSFLVNCTNSALSSHNLLWIFDDLSVQISLEFTTPFGRPSASFENSWILSLCLTITIASPCDPVQNTTPEGILSKCWCSLSLWHTHTHTTTIGIWDVAGATRSWLHSGKEKKSYAEIQKSLNSTEILHLDEKRNAQRWGQDMNYKGKKINCDEKNMWCHRMLNFCCANV